MYIVIFIVSNGCDFIYLVVFMVVYILEIWIYEMMCEGNYIIINGEVIIEFGMYVENLIFIFGCDFIIYYDLIVIDVVNILVLL